LARAFDSSALRLCKCWRSYTPALLILEVRAVLIE
jgi:hypothetical protein